MLSKFNYMKNIATIIALICLVQTGFGQSMTIKFCGKTDAVAPTIDPNNGQDQRGKSAIRLDWIKVGIIGNSINNAFYKLGETYINYAFPTGIFADQCDNSSGSSSNCSDCLVCKDIISVKNVNLGSPQGRFVGNAKIEGKNNDLYLMSTGANNVVCFETTPIDLSSYKNKKIEVSLQYEGIAQGGYSIRNINMTYKYDNNPYPSTPYFFNKNSNNTGLYADTYVIQNAVPNAVQDLSSKISFELNPNPIINHINMEYNSKETFNGKIIILNELLQELKLIPLTINNGKGKESIDITEFTPGAYFIQLSDLEGKSTTKKFIKS